MRSQNGTQESRKIVFFLENRHFLPSFVQTARRSFVTNDGPPSFQGAPDGWDSARFLGFF
jgi:hypothetical protein